MNHAVTKGRGGNQTPFRFMDVKTGVLARAIGLRFEGVLQLQQIFFQPILERGGGRFAAFAFCGAAKGKQQVFPRVDLFVHDSKKIAPPQGQAEEAERFLFARRGNEIIARADRYRSRRYSCRDRASCDAWYF